MNYRNYKNIDICFISVLVTFILYAVQINLSFGLWDEGFLWYGVQRTMLSEVPIRDFMAYDPGRYYWCASIMTILGSSSLIALRVSIGIFQLIGVYLSLKILKEYYKGNYPFSFLLFCSIVISLWMIPQHKVFDMVSSIVILYSLYRYSEDLTKRRALYLGITIGFIAFLGRNHGVYGLISSILVIVFYGFSKKSGIKAQFKNFSIGIIIGYLPMFAMIFFIDGYLNSFIGSILVLFSQGKTNITLPVPWFWLIDYSSVTLKDFLTSILFTIMPLYSVFGFVILLKDYIQKRDSSRFIICSTIINFTYMHVAFARADFSHLCQSIFPLLLGILCFLARSKSNLLCLIFSIFISIISSQLVLSRQPIYGLLSGSYKKININNIEFYVNKNTYNDIRYIKDKLVSIPNIDGNILVVPYWPGAYALLGIKSPVWENYALFPRSSEFQNQELKKIKIANPEVVLINNTSLDANDALKYENTHEIIYKYIIENYNLVDNVIDKNYYFYRKSDIQ